MKKIKGYLVSSYILVLGSILLTGCGKKTVSEGQLREDLLQSSAYTQYSDDLNVSIDNFKVTKRQTATENRIDTAWVEVDSSSDELTAHMYFIMTYELYNDGWQITNVEEDEIDKWYFVPLKEMTDEEIALYISEDVEIISKDVDLEEGTELITYTWVEPHNYCDVTYVKQDYFAFGTSKMLYNAGTWSYVTTDDMGSTENWNVVGTWGYEDTNDYVRLTIDDFLPDNPLLALYNDQLSDAKFNINGYIVRCYDNYMGYHEKKVQGPFEVTYNKYRRYNAEREIFTGNESPATLGYIFINNTTDTEFLITYDMIIYVRLTGQSAYELNRVE